MAALGWLLNLGFAGGSSSDAVPNAFSFTDLVNQAQGIAVESNTITVTGIDSSATVTFAESGHLSGLYSKNGGAYVDLASTTADNGDTFSLKLTTGAGAETETTITVTIGGVSDEWAVLTSLIANTAASTNVPTNYEIDDRTGFRLEPGESIRDWYGMRTRKKSADPRHPQELVRSRSDKFPGSISPEQDDTFIETAVTADDL